MRGKRAPITSIQSDSIPRRVNSWSPLQVFKLIQFQQFSNSSVQRISSETRAGRIDSSTYRRQTTPGPMNMWKGRRVDRLKG